MPHEEAYASSRLTCAPAPLGNFIEPGIWIEQGFLKLRNGVIMRPNVLPTESTTPARRLRFALKLLQKNLSRRWSFDQRFQLILDECDGGENRLLKRVAVKCTRDGRKILPD